MHECSIVEALIERVGDEMRRRGAVAVHDVVVRLGERSGVDADLLATAFEAFSEATVCDGAALSIERVPAAWACPVCGAARAPVGVLRCQACAAPLRLVAGDEIVLAHLELEVPPRV